jgi:CysZ protein
VYTNNFADQRAQSQFEQLLLGFKYFFAGLPLLIRHPPLLLLSLLPVLLTVVLLSLLALGSAWLVGQLLATAPPEWRVFLQALAFLLALLLGLTLYLPLARVLLAPFSEALSRKAHELTHGAVVYRSSLGWARAMWEGLKLVSLQLVILFAAFLLSFALPLVGHLFWLALAIVICGLDYLDVPLSARGLPLRAKLELLWQNKALWFGFGLAGYLLLFVPFINLLSLPIGVIGATLLTDRLKSRPHF